MVKLPDIRERSSSDERRPLQLRGMHGLGDNLHQRGIVKYLLEEKNYEVFLESSWVAVYHDLLPLGLKVVHKPTALRTQTKNAHREGSRFVPATTVPTDRDLHVIWYRRDDVNRLKSVLAAMCNSLHVPPEYAGANFQLPIPESWKSNAQSLIKKLQITKPIMIYRPLNERLEWGGCQSRNPDYKVYFQLAAAIRKHYHVISLADLEPKKEWLVGHPFQADTTFHKGEVPFETMAALFKEASIIYTSPGFAAVLAQAVQTPAVVVFGGFETNTSFSLGAKYSPTLTIGGDNCGCWNHTCTCNKVPGDMDAEELKVVSFAEEHRQRSKHEAPVWDSSSSIAV